MKSLMGIISMKGYFITIALFPIDLENQVMKTQYNIAHMALILSSDERWVLAQILRIKSYSGTCIWMVAH